MPAGSESQKPLSTGAKPGAKKKSVAPGAALAEARAVYLRFIEVIEHDARYPVEAYQFLQEGLEFTVRRAHGEEAAARPLKPAPGAPDPRHVDGAQLCLGLRDLALARWGRLAKLVLNAWRIHTTRDFGEMVFLLVTSGFLQKTDGDRLEHFDDVFSFAELEHLYELPCEPLDVEDIGSAA